MDLPAGEELKPGSLVTVRDGKAYNAAPGDFAIGFAVHQDPNPCLTCGHDAAQHCRYGCFALVLENAAAGGFARPVALQAFCPCKTRGVA